jgi:hypothetical protein
VPPGTRVVTSRGHELGVVRDVLIGARGSATYSVRRADADDAETPPEVSGDAVTEEREFLIPLDAVRALRRPDLAIVDERAITGLRRTA